MPDDPYQIATGEDLMLLGATPEDYDKHFVLTADIDLDPDLPGRKVFDKAVIAPDIDPNDSWYEFQGTPFTGVFDGKGHTIWRLTITGTRYLGLFGGLGTSGEVKNLGVVDVNMVGSAGVGGLVGDDWVGGVTACFWDVETSGWATSDGGTGKTTDEMQTAETFLDAGWDFVGESANGTEDIWWILEGRNYPRLRWELVSSAP